MERTWPDSPKTVFRVRALPCGFNGMLLILSQRKPSLVWFVRVFDVNVKHG